LKMVLSVEGLWSRVEGAGFGAESLGLGSRV